MIALDGRLVARAHDERCDVAVVGSGPAGAAVARTLARAGARVLVLEEGHPAPEPLPADAFGAMRTLYRDLGATLTRGRAPMPFVQGRAVGGTSVINGAISWRLPEDVHAAWVSEDPALAEAVSFARLQSLFASIEADLAIAPTDPAVAGAKNRLLAAGAEALGLAHRPIRRNVVGCEGLGRCMQGCPRGHKLAMDRSYLPDAVAAGARIASGVRVERVTLRGGRATGLQARAAGGGAVRVTADRVVLAASAVQSPVLLLRSGLRQGPVGRRFACHPGVSVSGRFPEPVVSWSGATQGHEVTGLRAEGIKLEALGFDVALAAARMPGVGRGLADGLDDLAHRAFWGAAIRAEGLGRVTATWSGRPRVRFDLAPRDLDRVHRALVVLGELMLAAGAEHVEPGVHGWPDRVRDVRTLRALPRPTARDVPAVATHLFGTCRMGSDPAASVVRPDFRHHHVEGLYVADSSVFPSNTGVNPQTSILALATLCAEGIAA